MKKKLSALFCTKKTSCELLHSRTFNYNYYLNSYDNKLQMRSYIPPLYLMKILVHCTYNISYEVFHCIARFI